MFESKKGTGLALQREYAQKRARALNKRDEEKIRLVEQKITQIAERRNVSLAQIERLTGTPGWERMYEKIITHLQGCDLTINLNPVSWFSAENRYRTYATTYEKNLVKTGDKTVLRSQLNAEGVITEDANLRLYADDTVTLPADWKDASLLHPQRKRLYKAMSATKGRGLQALTKVELGQNDKGQEMEGYAVDNRRFNLHAKQVFAALNYGMRPHGASVYYGYSHIILRPELKRKALYFPCDTFNVSMAANAVDQQCTFQTLGAILAYCSYGFGIWDAAIGKQRLPDTQSAFDLLEAHIFEQVKINKDVVMLKLSRKMPGDQRLEGEEWRTIRRNAYEWGDRNHVAVYVMSD